MGWDTPNNSKKLYKEQNASWTPTSGKITEMLGSGNNARISIIYLVLKWVFISAVILTILIIINYWCFRDSESKVPDITGDIKSIWEILTPIITLALGYAFGKSEQ